jgi:imidazoleglycerol-phosphate dehydratase
MIETSARKAAMRRKSRETEVVASLDLDPAEPSARIDSGIGFLDHMLTSLATHAGWALELSCRGDLEVDDHHSAEDCAITLGETLALALAKGVAEGRKPNRFGSAYAPLDEALARAVVDFSGRPFCRAELGLAGARLGDLAGENAQHFFWSLAAAARMTLHVDVLAGENAHHRAEAAFKALALALKSACAVEPRPGSAAARSGEGSGGSAGESTKGAVLLEELSDDGLAAALARLDGGRDGR